MMQRKLTVREEQLIYKARRDWRALSDAARNEYANRYVLAALREDRTARGVVRVLVHEVGAETRLPGGPQSRDRDEYRAAVVAAGLQRLEKNDWRSWRKYAVRLQQPDRGRFTSFVRTVLRRAAYDLHKRESSHSQATPLVREVSVPPADISASLDLVYTLECFQMLGPRARVAILLRAQGYSWKEVAEKAGYKNAGDATTQARYARAKLRTFLEHARRRTSGTRCHDDAHGDAQPSYAAPALPTDERLQRAVEHHLASLSSQAEPGG